MKLNIGCGKKPLKGYINLDFVKLPGVDVVHNLNKFPYPFKNNQFDEIFADNVLEHLDDLIRVMEEIHRISKKNAKIKIIVPYYNHHFAYQDPTHKHFFTLDSFDYFTGQGSLSFYSKARFEIVKRKPIPSWLGRLVPFKRVLLNMLGMVFGEFVKFIYFELRVIK